MTSGNTSEGSPRAHLVSVSWPIAVTLLGGILLLGGITPGSTFVLLGLIAILILLGARHPQSVPTLGWLCLGLAAATLLQALPLPLPVLRLVAPESARVWTETAQLLKLGSTSFPVSIEPGATRLEAARLTMYAGFALLCQRAAERVGARALCAIVAMAAGLLAIATLAHQALAAERVFGWYRPEHSGFVAPLMNSNNVGGFLNAGFFCSMGNALDQRFNRHWRQGFWTLSVLLFGSAVWVGSRAGVVLLMLGSVVLTLVLIYRPASTPERRRTAFGLLGVTVAGSLLAALNLARLNRELLSDSLAKLDVIAPAVLALKSYWLLGAGRGAFGVAVSPYVFEGPHESFEYAEILPLQWGVEWGAPLGALLLAALCYWLWPRRRALDVSFARFGAYLGLCVLCLHNFADFSLEVPVIALIAIAMSSVWRPHRLLRLKGSKFWLLTCFALLTAIAAVTIILEPVELGRTARHRIAALAREGKLTNDKLTAAISQHPADAYLVRLGAARAVAQGDRAALRFVGWAIERAPSSGSALLLLADTLRARGFTAQALPLLGRVIAKDVQLAGAAAYRALTWSPDDADQIVPSKNAAAAWEALARHSKTPSRRLHFLKQAASASPTPGRAQTALFSEVMSATDSNCIATLGSSCLDFARSQSGRLPERLPGVLELKAWVLERDGQAQQAFDLLHSHCPRLSTRVDCLYRLLAVSQRLSLEKHLLAADALLSVACANDAECARTEQRIAASLRERGQSRLALKHLLRAATLTSSASLWEAVAGLAKEVGDQAVLNTALRHSSGDRALGIRGTVPPPAPTIAPSSLSE